MRAKVTVGNCTVVHGSSGYRKDGSLSGRVIILATFRDHAEAVAYRAAKRRAGIHAVLEEARGSRGGK